MAEEIIGVSLRVDTTDGIANLQKFAGAADKTAQTTAQATGKIATSVTKAEAEVSRSRASFAKLGEQLSALPGAAGQAGSALASIGAAAGPIALVSAAVAAAAVAVR